MKKYVFIGVITGVVISIVLMLFKKKRISGMEFKDFIDSSAVADDIFGDAFTELPDKP